MRTHQTNPNRGRVFFKNTKVMKGKDEELLQIKEDQEDRTINAICALRFCLGSEKMLLMGTPAKLK